MSRKMKDSGVEWIGEIPEDWEMIKLRYSVNITTGKKDVNQGNPNGEYPFFTCSMFPYKSDEYSFDCEALLVAGNGMVGYSHYYNGKFEAYQRTYVLADFKRVNPIFLKHYISEMLVKYLENKSVGSVIDFIKLSDLKTFNVTLPSLNKQGILAEYLDKKVAEIDNIISKTQASIEEYKRYKQSIITEAVTKGLDPNVPMKDSGIEWIGEIPEHWDTMRPLKVCELIRGNSNFQKTDLSNQGEYVAVQYGKIYKVEEVDAAYQFYVDKSFHKESQVVRYDDTILISTSETMEDLGHSCYYNRKDDGLLGGEQLCLRPDTNILNGKFLYYATQYFKYELNQYATGLKVFRFRTDDLKKMTMVIPPIEEQKLLVNFLDNKIPVISKIISNKESLIEELASYKKSLIYEVVTGKKEVM